MNFSLYNWLPVSDADNSSFKLFRVLQLLLNFGFIHTFKYLETELRLQLLFWLLVPAWFAAHFWLIWARETRIFLVPLTIVFLPIILDLIQKAFEKSAEKQAA